MKALLIEDDPATVEAIRLCFEIHWPEAALTFTAKGLEGVELLRSEAPDVLILDLGLPDIDGIKVLEEIRLFSDIPVLIVSRGYLQRPNHPSAQVPDSSWCS